MLEEPIEGLQASLLPTLRQSMYRMKHTQRRVNQALRNRKNQIERKERIPTSLNQNAETVLQHLIPMQVISNTDFSIKRIRTMSLARANMSWLMVRRERTSLIR